MGYPNSNPSYSHRAYIGLYGDNGKEREATIQGLGFGNTLGGPPPHSVVETSRGNGDYIRVLLYSYYTGSS